MAAFGVSLANGEQCFAGTKALVQDTIYEDAAKKQQKYTDR
jgi:acyl-CoA reductase-like NAD-dependent aldehyde dehydrogenase